MNEQLSKETLKSLKKEGMSHVQILKVRRDSHGYPDYLLSAQDHSGFEFRGWLREGESVQDIRWDTENRDGWADELKA